MAQACQLQVVGQTPTHISLEGRDRDLKLFADRMEQITRLLARR
jgi:hypothetical protein